MNILALETATEACSVALWHEGEITQLLKVAPREHVKLLLPMIDQLLANASVSVKQLDAIAFGRGPGSFTGLRIAAGITQGIAFGAEIPVIPVSTLAALAQGVIREHGQQHVLVALDARMQEVYWAAYEKHKDSVSLLGDEVVCSPDKVSVPDGEQWVGAGSGWSEYKEQLDRQYRPSQEYPDACPQACDIAHLAAIKFMAGEAVIADLAQPIYLRNNVANKPKINA
ncbi:MAG: tRNA (adenosine(37)-N6)-threonylcarbamoyltransferase complex dimerization subunit type 1 TsaB [Gammaproteobacteria bacterium]